jgi:hypothetical protein
MESPGIKKSCLETKEHVLKATSQNWTAPTEKPHMIMPRQCMILPNIASLSMKREHFRMPAVNAEKQTSYSVRSYLIITVLCGNKSTFDLI